MSAQTCPDCGLEFASDITYDAHRRTVERKGYDPDALVVGANSADPDAKRYRGRVRREGRAENKQFGEVYRKGAKDARANDKAKRDRRRQARSRRPPAHRRRVSNSKSARELKKGARQLASPMRAQIGSGMQFIGLSLAVTALYLVLTAEEQTGTFSKALGGLQRGLHWLSDPTAPIPFGHD
jgi:hypothetical protein